MGWPTSVGSDLGNIIGYENGVVTPSMEGAYSTIKSRNNLGLERSFLTFVGLLGQYFQKTNLANRSPVANYFAAAVINAFAAPENQDPRKTLEAFQVQLKGIGLRNPTSFIRTCFGNFVQHVEADVAAQAAPQHLGGAPSAPVRTHGFIVTGVCPN